MDTVADGTQKHLNYREQFKRLNKAVNNQFYLEAIFIEYCIMEDRTESVLRHAGKWEAYLKKRGRYGPSIDSKIKYIQNFARENGTLLHRYFSDDLLDEILVWKDKRNDLVHVLFKQKLSTIELASFAEEGKRMTELLRNRATNFRRAAQRACEKSV